MSPADLPERIANRITVQPDGCWRWDASCSNGYGQVRFGTHSTSLYPCAKAHRLTYHLLRDGSFPVYGGRDGLQIDHLCLFKRCVNPAHMEVVTPQENGRRGVQHREMMRAARQVVA